MSCCRLCAPPASFGGGTGPSGALLGVYVFPPGNVPLSANIVQSTTGHHNLAGVCRGKWHGSTRITQAPEVDIFVDN